MRESHQTVWGICLHWAVDFLFLITVCNVYLDVTYQYYRLRKVFFIFQLNMSQSATSVKPTLLLDLGNLHILVIELLEWYCILVILMHCLFGK